jgi:chromosome segregation ATPase
MTAPDHYAELLTKLRRLSGEAKLEADHNFEIIWNWLDAEVTREESGLSSAAKLPELIRESRKLTIDYHIESELWRQEAEALEKMLADGGPHNKQALAEFTSVQERVTPLHRKIRVGVTSLG